MIQLHQQTPILLATQTVDFRKGIDGFVALVPLLWLMARCAFCDLDN